MTTHPDSPKDQSPNTTTLAECPIGLFLYGGDLCLKTEYGNNEGRIDAYIVDSGEMFWGDPPQTINSQRATVVTPVENVTLYALPVAFRVMGEENRWMIFQSEEAAQLESEARNQDYEGLYVRKALP